jgi:hypothetical protein
MVGEYIFSNAHNSSLTPKFAISFCPSYFATQEANVGPKVSATRQVIQTDELTSSSSSIIKARGIRGVMPQSFHPLHMEEKRTLLAKGEETTTPQTIKASNSHVPRIHVHKKTHTIFH